VVISAPYIERVTAFETEHDSILIGVTNREGDYNRQTEAHDWKRRGERLVRASGLPYTIVRPGWTPCATSPTCHCPRSRSGCEMTSKG